MKRRYLAQVHIQDGETLENALRRFKRKVLQEDIIKEVKRHAFYLKPGQKKRIKSALARKRNRKKRNRDIAQNENSKSLHRGRRFPMADHLTAFSPPIGNPQPQLAGNHNRMLVRETGYAIITCRQRNNA